MRKIIVSAQRITWTMSLIDPGDRANLDVYSHIDVSPW